MTAANATRLTILLCVCVVATERPVGAQQQPSSDGTSLGITTSQTAAPVRLRGYLASAGTFLYETAKVENLSPKPISGVTFGVLVTNPSNPRARTLLRSSAAVSLPPGGTQDVSVRLLPMAQLQEFERALTGGAAVTLGVLAVEWTDGTKWLFDPADTATDFSIGTGRIVAAEQP